MKIVEPNQLGAAGVKATGVQPHPDQAHKGTVVHRRWDGAKAAALPGDGFFELDVQREPDDIEAAANFAFVVTLEMSGEIEIYNEVLNRVAVKPAVAVAA